MNDVILFAKGFLVEFTKINELKESAACVKSFITDFDHIEKAFDDLKKGDYKSAIPELAAWAASLPADAQKCSSATGELKEVEEYFGQYVKDHSKLVAKITEALANADERKEVMADVSSIEADIKAQNFESCGTTGADLVTLVLGKVTPTAASFFLY